MFRSFKKNGDGLEADAVLCTYFAHVCATIGSDCTSNEALPKNQTAEEVSIRNAAEP